MPTVPTTDSPVRVVGHDSSAIALRLDAQSRVLRISVAPRPLTRRAARRNGDGESVTALLARLAPTVPAAPPTRPIPVAGPTTVPLLVPALRPQLISGGSR